MMILPPDLEAFLCAHIRTQLRARGVDVEVDNREPRELRTPLSRPLVVVRDDGGAKASQLHFHRRVGVSVLAGSRDDDREARSLSRLVFALLTDDELALLPGPIAAVRHDGCYGPYRVDDPQDVSRSYLVADYSVIGD